MKKTKKLIKVFMYREPVHGEEAVWLVYDSKEAAMENADDGTVIYEAEPVAIGKVTRRLELK